MVYATSQEQANRLHHFLKKVAVVVSNSISNITAWLWFLNLKIKSWPSYCHPKWGSWRVFTASPFPDSKLVNVISTWHLYWQPTPGFGRLLQCLHTMISCLAYTPLRNSSQLGHWQCSVLNRDALHLKS